MEAVVLRGLTDGNRRLCTALDAILERLMFGAGLVFNQSWEDPEIDLEALAVTPNDTVLTIASAGDNALSLALTEAERVYAIDLNPAQIHLLELKIAATQHLDYADFFHLFSLAPAARAHSIYRRSLRSHLDSDSREFWDARIWTLRAGLYRAGVFGRALWMLRTYLRVVCGPRTLARLFLCESLSEQASFYRERIHSRWWNFLARPFAAQWPILLLFGVHPHQARRVRGQQFADVLAGGIAHALSTLPARDNFFWQQALLGRYLVPPPYLRPENFASLRKAATRIVPRVGRVEDFIQSLPPGSVTCFDLLDAPDWLSVDKTIECWDMLRRAAAPRARVLFRSIDPSYRLPESVLTHWRDESEPAWTVRERTGVYAGVYLYVLRERDEAR